MNVRKLISNPLIKLCQEITVGLRLGIDSDYINDLMEQVAITLAIAYTEREKKQILLLFYVAYSLISAIEYHLLIKNFIQYQKYIDKLFDLKWKMIKEIEDQGWRSCRH